MRRSSPIGSKVRRLSILSSVTALVAASVALLFVQLHEVRDGLTRQFGTVADLIAANVAAAVDFDDPDAAGKTLASLEKRPDVMRAGIVVHGKLFASYERKGGSPGTTIPEPPRGGSGFRMGRHDLTIFRLVSARGHPLGTLFIQSSLGEIGETRRRFASITGLVAIPALLVAIMVSYPLQRAISRPLLSLAGLAGEVSASNDYSVRAPEVRSAAEVEQFIATFNQMLGEIEKQHAEIEDARATLERRVTERTAELAQRAEQLEEKRLELAAANRELEAFSYSVSHDLRAPLRAIDGFSKALLSSYPAKVLDDRGVHYLERVRAGTQKMAALIDDMLHLARVSRHSLERSDIDITAIAAEAAADQARFCPDRAVSCEIEPGMHGWADPHLLMIVFTNLLANAWKFTRNRSDARISVAQVSSIHGPAFCVRDNGAGFDMAYTQKLFGAFQRLHTEAEFEGTGIGLATVKRIIARHGGTIWAEAEAGVGAAFFFTLGGKA